MAPVPAADTAEKQPRRRRDYVSPADEAWDAFQELRIHYAPYAAGIASHLLYSDIDVTPERFSENAAAHMPPPTDM